MPPNVLVSVVMPVYNSETFLREAIESILNQTFTNFELIAIDDCSTDSSPDFLVEYQKRDDRILIHRQAANSGPATARNTGLNLASGKYIAFMDSDDISLPNRLEKQVAFLDTHPDIGIVGSGIRLIDRKGNHLGNLQVPTSDLAIRWTCLFSNAFMNSTVMLRRFLLVENALTYDSTKEPEEDYDLWVRFLNHARGANFPDILVCYRIHPASLTNQYNQKLQDKPTRTIKSYIEHELPNIMITETQIQQVINGFRGNSDERYKRANSAEIYVRSWEAYVQAHQGDGGLAQLQNDVILIAIKLALFPPFQPGWRKILNKIASIEPRWSIILLRNLPQIILTKSSSIVIKWRRK